MKRGLMKKRYRWAVKLLEQVDRFSKPVFECNVCERPIRHPFDGPKAESPLMEKYKVAGGGFRAKEQCPFCLSNDRLRFVIEVMKLRKDILSDTYRVLEFAPIMGLERYLKKHMHCDYLTGDIVPGKAMRVLDITNIALRDETYDFIICNHVLEQVEDEEKAIREMMRVVNRDGCILLTMPVALSLDKTLEKKSTDTPEKRLQTYGHPNYVRLYGLDVKQRLENYGLRVEEIIAKESMPEAVEKYGLIPEDRIYLCWVK